MPHFSRADLYQLAGIVAIETGIDFHNSNSTSCLKFGKYCMPNVSTYQTSLVNFNRPTRPPVDLQLKIPIYYGRKDATFQNKNITQPFPTGDLNTEELLVFFADTFGIDSKQAVAIMGAHTLGGMNHYNSGCNGAFTEVLNRYFLINIF